MACIREQATSRDPTVLRCRRAGSCRGGAGCVEESETLQQQAQNNTLAQFSASPDLQNEFVGAVIGAIASSEDLSTQILNNPELSQKLLGELVPLIYQGLKTAGEEACPPRPLAK